MLIPPLSLIESLDRILNLVAVELKFPDKDAFLSSYSDYLLNQWNYDDKNIMEFPYNILGIDFELQFYKKHARIIVPLLVLKGESDSIKKMCTFLNKSKIELYEVIIVFSSYRVVINFCYSDPLAIFLRDISCYLPIAS